MIGKMKWLLLAELVWLPPPPSPPSFPLHGQLNRLWIKWNFILSLKVPEFFVKKIAYFLKFPAKLFDIYSLLFRVLIFIVFHNVHCILLGERPKILGLTASLINNKTPPSNLERVLEKLELIMQSNIETASDLVSVSYEYFHLNITIS